MLASPNNISGIRTISRRFLFFRTYAMSANHSVPKLKDQSLFKEQCYVGGEWIDAKSGQTFEVHGESMMT